MTMTTDLVATFKAARAAGVPILAIWSADQAATVDAIVKVQAADVPVIQWDIIRGIQGITGNALGLKVAAALVGKDDPAAVSGVPTDALRLLARAPEKTIVFFYNLQRYWEAPDVMQAIWNLRELYKANYRTFVGLGPGGKVPAELEHEVVVVQEPLPSRDELRVVFDEIHAAAGIPVPSGTEGTRQVERAVDAMAGLSAFAAEQILAMSITGGAVNFDRLRARRRQAIENTEGCTVYKGEETFADVGGLDQIKEFFLRVKNEAREPIKAIAFIDELDKSMAGAGAASGSVGDSSGTAQYQHRALLTNIQDTKSPGAMLYGVPGAGKTAFAKALANELGVELIMLDLGAMQSKYVGASQERTNQALKIVNAVGQGRTLYLGTCNATATISTELRRRFRTFGEWFFDLPTSAELESILRIYLKKYGLKVTEKNPLPDMSGWTGAEVGAMTYLCYDLNYSFVKAAEFVVPMVTSAADVVERLRDQADGKFLDASRPGFYKKAETAVESAARGRRAMTVEDVLAVKAQLPTMKRPS